MLSAQGRYAEAEKLDCARHWIFNVVSWGLSIRTHWCR